MPIDPDLIERFNAKWVKDEASGCHLWTGAHLPKGYGIIKRPGERRQFYAHRLAYMIHKGEIPKRIQVCHSCDNPACVNPEHLFLGTSSDNHQDMKTKDRHLYGERNGNAKLTKRDIIQMRAMQASGIQQNKLALLFGVHPMTVSRIITGKRWAHLRPSD